MEEQEMIDAVKVQVDRYLKYCKFYKDDRATARNVALTEGWMEISRNPTKEYNYREVYNAIARGVERFFRNEWNQLNLTKTQREELEGQAEERFETFKDCFIDVADLTSDIPLERTEWGHLGVFFQDKYPSTSQIKDVLKRTLGTLKRKDREMLVVMYGGLIKGDDDKRKSYSEVAEKLGVAINTVWQSNIRIIRTFKREYERAIN